MFVWLGDGANEVEKSEGVTVAMVRLKKLPSQLQYLRPTPVLRVVRLINWKVKGRTVQGKLTMLPWYFIGHCLSGHCGGLLLRLTQDWGCQLRAWGFHFHAVCDLKINTRYLLTRLILSSFPGLRELWSIWKDLGRYSDNPSKTRLRTTEFHRTFSGLG